jgi:hypothetical protein
MKEKSEKPDDEASPPENFLSSLPWCVFVIFVPWWLVLRAAPAGR